MIKESKWDGIAVADFFFQGPIYKVTEGEMMRAVEARKRLQVFQNFWQDQS